MIRQSNVKSAVRCEYCGREFMPRRAGGRFCGASCRRRAWLDRNPEKAAELAVKDKARLKAYIIERGGVWIDRPSPNRSPLRNGPLRTR